MNKWTNNNTLKFIMALVFIYAVFHLVRDIMQIAGMQSFFTEVLSKPDHKWCSPICSYVTFPPEIFSLIVIPIIWNKNEINIWGRIAIMSPVIISIMWLLP